MGHHNKSVCSKIGGIIVISLLVYSWVGGFTIPFFILFLWYQNYTTAAIIISSLILLPYIIPISPQPWICRLYIKYGSSYFDGGCTQIVESKPKMRNINQPILAGVHPHGIFCLSYFLCCGLRFRALEDTNDKKLQIEFADNASQFENWKERKPKPGFAVGYLCKAPIFSFFLTKLTGCVLPSDNNCMKSVMKKGISFGLLPGGFNEATAFKYGENVIYIKARKGFIKYCLQYGYELLPAYHFGECESYKNLFATQDRDSWIWKLKQWFSQRKIPTVFPIGPYWYSPFLPRSDIGLHTVFSGNTYCIGNKIENPTQEEIDKCHDWYINEMIGLFERNKWR
eukprot:253191_1